MGERFVFADFDAWYLMLSHKIDKHRISFRYDRFMVQEDDIIPEDVNNSDGYGYTLAWRYDIDKTWQVGVEHHYNKNTAHNRLSLDQLATIDQQQTMAVLQYRWR